MNKMDSENSIKNTENQEEKNFNVGALVTDTERFLEKNRKVIIIVLAVVVVGIAAYFGYKHLYAMPKEKIAQAELFGHNSIFKTKISTRLSKETASTRA